MKYIWTLLLICTVGHKIQAQIDIPVDHHTGNPIISIPLCVANDRSLSHKISVVYDASGVKVDAPPSMVGQNWAMIVAGAVTRELR